MGFSGIGPGSLILILVIVVLLFGTKRLRNLGGDLGTALRGFKKGLAGEDEADETTKTSELESKAANTATTESEKNKVDQ